MALVVLSKIEQRLDAVRAVLGGADVTAVRRPSGGGPVELDRVVPPAGNMGLAGQQFWLGTARAGQPVRFWADTDLIHLFIGGTRVKTVRSHLSATDLAALVAHGAVPRAPRRCPR